MVRILASNHMMGIYEEKEEEPEEGDRPGDEEDGGRESWGQERTEEQGIKKKGKQPK